MCGGIEAEPVMLGQTIGGQIQTDRATSTDVVLMINHLSVCLFVLSSLFILLWSLWIIVASYS